MTYGLIYLASPYSASASPDSTETADAALREKRYQRVAREAGRMMMQGYSIFCPITHSHPIDLTLPHIEGHDFWLRQDFAVLRHCSLLCVLMLDGWDRSTGIRREMEFARHCHIPIEYRADSEDHTEIERQIAGMERAARFGQGACGYGGTDD